MTNPLDGVNSWLYHLGDVDAAEAARIGANTAGLVVIDYAHDGGSGSVAHTPAELAVMRGGNDKLIVSYLSIGEAEDYRPYWQSSWNTNPPDFLSASNPEWPDNFKVKYWDPQWQAIIFDYVDKIVASGFNGVYMDIIDAYQYWEDINPVPGMNYAQEMADFVAAIKAHAEQKLASLGDTRDFVIMGQNGEELLDNPTYLNALDGVGKEDLRFYYPNGSEGSFQPTPDGWWTGSQPYLEQAEAAGVQVFVVEYMTQARQTQYSTMLASEIQYLREHGIPLYVSEDRDLTGIYPQPDGGDPIIFGTAVGETVTGTDVADVIFALEGNDVLIGGSGADNLQGGTGTDTASYSTATAGVTVSLLTPAVNTGDAAGDTFVSIENISGSAFADIISGNNGANVINGSLGNDLMTGYAGNDTYYVSTAGDRVIEAAGGGSDVVLSGVSYVLAAGQEIETLSTTNNAGGGAINLTGNAFNNSITGNAGANVLIGGGGVDTLTGLGGNDCYAVDSATDVVNEAVGGGIDRVYASATYTLGAGQEIETLSTNNNAWATLINLTGNAFNNTIIGNAAGNTLNGGLGNDTLTGLNGADKFLFNTALNAATNHDTITDFNVAADTIQLENAIFTLLTATGTLAAGLFKDLSLGAQDANDVIVYNHATGDLFYDTNGLTAGGQTLFADVANGTALTFADFVVI